MLHMGRTSGYDFVEPLILKILRESKGSMTTLAINYRVNQSVGRTINLKIVQNHLIFLAKKEKISKIFNKGNGIIYYKIIA
jgi:hypothetical protein